MDRRKRPIADLCCVPMLIACPRQAQSHDTRPSGKMDQVDPLTVLENFTGTQDDARPAPDLSGQTCLHKRSYRTKIHLAGIARLKSAHHAPHVADRRGTNLFDCRIYCLRDL